MARPQGRAIFHGRAQDPGGNTASIIDEKGPNEQRGAYLAGSEQKPPSPAPFSRHEAHAHDMHDVVLPARQYLETQSPALYGTYRALPVDAATHGHFGTDARPTSTTTVPTLPVREPTPRGRRQTSKHRTTYVDLTPTARNPSSKRRQGQEEHDDRSASAKRTATPKSSTQQRPSSTQQRPSTLNESYITPSEVRKLMEQQAQEQRQQHEQMLKQSRLMLE